MFSIFISATSPGYAITSLMLGFTAATDGLSDAHIVDDFLVESCQL